VGALIPSFGGTVMVDLSQLEHAISYRFADKRLLSVALTHPSAGP